MKLALSQIILVSLLILVGCGGGVQIHQSTPVLMVRRSQKIWLVPGPENLIVEAKKFSMNSRLDVS